MSGINALFAVEPLMYFGVGFLSATLIAIAIFPFALNRAVRLTTRRVMATMPHSLSEASAERDALRATFAVAIRKLEVRTEELVKRVAAQAAQLGRNSAANVQLKEALDEKSRLVVALEVREGAMMSRENSLIQELLALRDEARRNRESTSRDSLSRDSLPRDSLSRDSLPRDSLSGDSVSSMRLPPALSPWK